MSSDKEAAQRRADQIAAFRTELTELAGEGVAPFDARQLAAIAAHHDALLRRLAREFDVDTTTAAKRMSRGMQIASLLGAAALTAAIVSFVYRVWGVMPTSGQVALLTAAPLVSIVVMLIAGRVEKTRYVASLFAIVACGAFVLQTVVLGQIFNQRGSPHVLVAWGTFALAIAIPWRFGVPFALGVVALVVYVPSLLLWAGGVSWVNVPERLELLAASAALALLALWRIPRELAIWMRAVLLTIVLGILLVLSSSGGSSLMPFGEQAVEIAYQFVSVATAITLLTVGLRRGLSEVVAIGSLFSGLFLLVRFVDWWWEWMPKYLFFLILTAVALAWLWGLRLARRRLASRAA